MTTFHFDAENIISSFELWWLELFEVNSTNNFLG